MNYKNAAEILPEGLLKELQTLAEGELLYIPKSTPKKEWGEKNGSKTYYSERNKQIRDRYHAGADTEQLAKEYGLAANTIHKIIYG